MATLSQTAQIALSYIQAGQVPFITGAPGIGKSSLVYQVARTMGFDDDQIIEFRPNLHDPVDLMGLPANKDGKMIYCQPSWLPTEGSGLLFIDELPQATPAMQNALSQLLLDRRIGDYKLPEGWCMIVAGNRAKDRAATARMPTHVANRLGHIETDFSEEDFIKWCYANDQPDELIAFAKFKPALLESFDPNQTVNCTPRSLVMAGTQVGAPSEILFDAMQGLIGEGAATEFTAFIKVWRDLPDIDSVLSNPKKAKLPEDGRLDVAFAITTAVASATDVDTFPAAVEYMTRLPAEFQVMFIKDVIIRTPAIARNSKTKPLFHKWAEKNNALMSGS